MAENIQAQVPQAVASRNPDVGGAGETEPATNRRHREIRSLSWMVIQLSYGSGDVGGVGISTYRRMEWPMSATLPPITEASFQKTVIGMARVLKWTCFHPRYSIGSDAGYPDLTLIHPTHGALWLELKTRRGRISEAQRDWIDRLTDAGQRAYIVYPDQFDVIEALLRGDETEAA